MDYSLFILGYTHGMNIQYREVEIYRFHPILLNVNKKQNNIVLFWITGQVLCFTTAVCSASWDDTTDSIFLWM